MYMCHIQMLLGFLKRVVDCNENLMNLNNVAMIMAPNLFLVASGKEFYFSWSHFTLCLTEHLQTYLGAWGGSHY